MGSGFFVCVLDFEFTGEERNGWMGMYEPSVWISGKEEEV